MIATFDHLPSNPEESLALLEHLYEIAERQGIPFVLKLDKREYIFPLFEEREVRIRQFKHIIEEHKPP